MLHPTTVRRGYQGICEVCDKQSEVFNTQGNIKMCQGCIEEEKQHLENATLANRVITDMRAVDSVSELKADIFNAETVAITELKAAIWADENIPDTRKQFVYTQECERHFLASQKRVFEKRQAVIDEESIQARWQTAAQTAAGQLSAVEREHFKKLNMSYQPTQVKTPKPGKSKSPAKNYKGSEFRDAAAKYNVDVAAVRMISIQRNVSADEAGRIFAEQIAKSKLAN
jgi:hypothetical protein